VPSDARVTRTGTPARSPMRGAAAHLVDQTVALEQRAVREMVRSGR
jgi:hypothetical protein